MADNSQTTAEEAFRKWVLPAAEATPEFHAEVARITNKVKSQTTAEHRS